MMFYWLISRLMIWNKTLRDLRFNDTMQKKFNTTEQVSLMLNYITVSVTPYLAQSLASYRHH